MTNQQRGRAHHHANPARQEEHPQLTPNPDSENRRKVRRVEFKVGVSATFAARVKAAADADGRSIANWVQQCLPLAPAADPGAGHVDLRLRLPYPELRQLEQAAGDVGRCSRVRALIAARLEGAA